MARLIDGSRFQEFKHLYGETMLCGFARIDGFEIGILANNGVLFSESAVKGAHFIELCCKRDIPLLFLVDVSGFMVGSAVERQGIAKHGAKFMTAMACADVPKYTIITGGSYAEAYFAMLGRAFRPNATLMWPSAHAALMGPEQAATTLAMVRDNIHQREGTSWTEEEREAFRRPILRDFEAFADPYNYARHLWCDMVIDPVETREVMALLLDLAGRTPAKPTKSACSGCSGNRPSGALEAGLELMTLDLAGGERGNAEKSMNPIRRGAFVAGEIGRHNSNRSGAVMLASRRATNATGTSPQVASCVRTTQHRRRADR